MPAHTPTGILLMAYGSPERLDDLEPYLLDIRGGRPTPPALVEEIRHRYALIGGRSPLLDLTKAQAAALQAELNRRFEERGRCFRAYTGMRHWEPRIQAAVRQMAADGIREVVALVMAPHSSRLSTGAYFTRLEESQSQEGAAFQLSCIQNWHDRRRSVRRPAARDCGAGRQPAGAER
jgi:ferrochelatase